MMGFAALIIVAAGAAGAVIYLLTYVPIIKKKPFSNSYYSPRLLIVEKILSPFDAGMTLILIAGSWLGITSALGISAMVYNVLTGIGLSIGVIITKRFFGKIWRKQYEEKLIKQQANLNNKIMI